MASLQTAVRNAVWLAIDTCPATANPIIKTRIRYDSLDRTPNRGDSIPVPADCPALEIFPGSALPKWYVHRNQLWPYAVDFRLITADWLLDTPEDLVEKIIRAVWNEKGAGTRPFIREAGAKIPQNGNGPVGYLRVRAGQEGTGPKMIVTRFSMVLNFGFNPLIPNP